MEPVRPVRPPAPIKMLAATVRAVEDPLGHFFFGGQFLLHRHSKLPLFTSVCARVFSVSLGDV